MSGPLNPVVDNWESTVVVRVVVLLAVTAMPARKSPVKSSVSRLGLSWVQVVPSVLAKAVIVEPVRTRRSQRGAVPEVLATETAAIPAAVRASNFTPPPGVTPR